MLIVSVSSSLSLLIAHEARFGVGAVVIDSGLLPRAMGTSFEKVRRENSMKALESNNALAS